MKEPLRHLKQFAIILTVCYIAVVAINYGYSGEYDGYVFLKQFVNVFTYTFAIYLANSLVLSDYYLRREKNFINILIGGILVNLLTALVVLIIEFFGYLIFVKSSVPEAFQSILTKSGVMLWFSMTISTTVYAVLLIRRKDKIEVLQQKGIAVKATASFESLKNQLDPHFLFNSLNVLSALIEEDPVKAREFTIGLSKIYRYVLDQKDKNLISVEEELNFARLYMALLKVRFEDAIIANFPEESSVVNYRIVPLSLQLLLENAIKHNVISELKPLRIDIFTEEGFLVVKNNYQKKQTLENAVGIGLQNIIQRYSLVSDKDVIISKNLDFYTVKLPLISEASFFYFQDQLVTEDLFENAYYKMDQLKQFYISLITTCILIPLVYLINQWYMPDFKWWIALTLFMLFALVINGLKALNIFGKWENKMIKRQINKN